MRRVTVITSALAATVRTICMPEMTKKVHLRSPHCLRFPCHGTLTHSRMSHITRDSTFHGLHCFAHSIGLSVFSRRSVGASDSPADLVRLTNDYIIICVASCDRGTLGISECILTLEGGRRWTMFMSCEYTYAVSY